MGRDGFPFNQSDVQYTKGMCPVVEDMKFNKLIGFEPCVYDLSDDDFVQIQNVFEKVHENLADLKDFDRKAA